MRAVLVGILCWAGLAQADPNHSNPRSAAWKQGGQVVGVKVTLRFQTTGTRFPKARVALVTAGQSKGIRQKGIQTSEHADLFLHQFAPVEVPTDGTPIEHTLSVRYGDGNQLRSGMRVAILTRWPASENQSLFHLWGDGGDPQEIDLP